MANEDGESEFTKFRRGLWWALLPLGVVLCLIAGSTHNHDLMGAGAMMVILSAASLATRYVNRAGIASYEKYRSDLADAETDRQRRIIVVKRWAFVAVVLGPLWGGFLYWLLR